MPRCRSGSRIASGSQLIEVAIPAGPAHPPRFFDAEGLRRQRSECEVDRRSLRSQGVPAHDFGARRLIDINVGAGHAHTIHHCGLSARAAVSGYAGRRFGLTNGCPYTSLTDRDGTGHSRRRSSAAGSGSDSISFVGRRRVAPGPPAGMQTLERFVSKRLRLRVNRDRSAVDRPWKRKSLRYSMTVERAPRLKVAPESESRLRPKLKAEFTDQSQGTRPDNWTAARVRFP